MADIFPVVLVTGASRGLGRGIALELAKSGYSVAVNYTSNLAAAEATALECCKSTIHPEQQFQIFKADISLKEERETMVENIIKKMGRIDALVNNAGIAPALRADLLDTSEDSFEQLMRVNLQGPHFLTQRVARHWLNDSPKPALKAGFTIIFVTSISAYTVSLYRGEYCISKAGLSMSNQLWASRLAGEGIQVLELRPGIMLTDMTSTVKEKYDDLIAEGLVPQKRWGTPQDLGTAVTAVLDGHFPFSAGTVIDIDGGFHIQRL
ncbi:MAG: 3-ketoacyl-ACP reductase [SAR324 cluster bacterium]|nr:3-ketoacyl-ACP reductase [SAR324 cluster bacterium]